MLLTSIFSFSNNVLYHFNRQLFISYLHLHVCCRLQMLSILDKSKIMSFGKELYKPCNRVNILDLTLPQTTNCRVFQTERICRQQFKFDESGRMFSKWVENTVRKAEIARDEQFLLFSQCFQKRLALQSRKNQGLFGKGLNVVGLQSSRYKLKLLF